MQGNKPSRKKQAVVPSDPLIGYLTTYNRAKELPIQYDDMLRYMAAIPLLNSDGKDTLWETVFYDQSDVKDIHQALCQIYALLNTEGDLEVIEHLSVARVDFCTFGNTKPFRIRIINRLNDNYDHFYIKQIDASRIYGLELEGILSPNRLNFIIHENTIIEEHVAGVPGDDFMEHYLDVPKFDQIRIAKEFIKFNERCFVRLLGDMRAYNYIVDITPDIEGSQYRIRAIDFDQQSYEGRKSFYLPQFFKENNPIIYMGIDHLKPEAVRQYQLEERSLIARRARNSKTRINDLLDCMQRDQLSSMKKVQELRQELATHHRNSIFDNCQTMGEIVLANLKLVLKKEFYSVMGS
ncbi:MAG: hypothetical protein AAFQ02_08780 [Bacteroidota bacterium]